MVKGNRKVNLTSAGVSELTAELAELKTRRVEVAERLKAAKEQGDLTENFDWATAQDDFKYVENRIDEVEQILRHAKVIKSAGGGGAVGLGSTVELSQDGKKRTYTLVGSLESNPKVNKISEASPVGRALLGKKVGETVKIKVPAGTESFKVTKIS